MKIDWEKVEEMTLALMHLTTFEEGGETRSWKGHDWDVLNRLHEKGWISNPASKTKSVVLTEAGRELSEKLLRTNFGIGASSGAGRTGVRPQGKKNQIYQFKVTLLDIAPPIWRRIQVPAVYSFWDLHVAIQDAMGWQDYHLHQFRIKDPQTGDVAKIGIPGDELFEDKPDVPGWEVSISDYFPNPGSRADYLYDFGDGWEHDVVLEDIVSREAKKKYPQCVTGASACPPEDCGGVGGYDNLVRVMGDPSDEEYATMVDWLGERYDPERFDPKKVRFDNPRKRWDKAFGDY